MTQALRVFFRKSDSQIVWTHQVTDFADRQPVPFPTTVEEDLAEIPYKIPVLDSPPLGGSAQDYACIEVQDTQKVEAYLASDTNRIVDGALVIGEPRLPPPPDPDYARACEILKTSPAVITQPEIWELLRIFGKKLGYQFK